jgi:uncharacterized membrane protein
VIYNLQLSVLKNTAPIHYNFRSSYFLLSIFYLSFLAIWIFGFISPLIEKIENPLIQILLSKAYSGMCHQDSEKCISLAGELMLVCARCAGIYFGALLTGILTSLTRIPELNLKHLTILSLPLILDVSFTIAALYSYSKFIAFITGLSFGCAITFIILAEVKQLILNNKYRK